MHATSGWGSLAILGSGGFQELGYHPLADAMVSLGTVMAPVGVSFSLLICYNDHITEAKGLVEVNSPAILDLFGSLIGLCLVLVLCHSLKRLCPAPFLPVSFYLLNFWRML